VTGTSDGNENTSNTVQTSNENTNNDVTKVLPVRITIATAQTTLFKHPMKTPIMMLQALPVKENSNSADNTVQTSNENTILMLARHYQ
jgi:hypothetical protein